VTPLCAVYLVIAGIGLHVITHGLGLGNVTLGQALAVYFFSLAIGLIIPIPMDIGLTEFGGVGALLVIGVNRNAAVGVMLLNRVLSIVAALLIALVAMAFLRDELRAVLRDRPRRAPRPRESAEQAYTGRDHPTPQHTPNGPCAACVSRVTVVMGRTTACRVALLAYRLNRS